MFGITFMDISPDFRGVVPAKAGIQQSPPWVFPLRYSLLDRPPEFTIGPRSARTRWRAMTARDFVNPA
jgi:hypothetical protein